MQLTTKDQLSQDSSEIFCDLSLTINYDLKQMLP